MSTNRDIASSIQTQLYNEEIINNQNKIDDKPINKKKMSFNKRKNMLKE